MKLFALILLCGIPALAQFDASTLQGKQPCTATRTTNCIPVADSSGALSVGATAPNAVGVSTLYAQNYSGADASVRINACNTAVVAAGGGTCDARYFGGAQSMSQQINVGSATSGSLGIGVTLLLPSSADWTWGLTGGTACGIWQYSSTSIVGEEPGGGGNKMLLDTRAGANMDALWCTDPAPTGGGAYVRAEGFFAVNNGAGTFAHGLLHPQKLYDESIIRRVGAYNPTGAGWVVDNVCCGTTLDLISASSAYGVSGGGIPFSITNSIAATISNSTMNGAPTGLNNLYIGAGNSHLTFLNTYMETNFASADLTTAATHIDSGSSYIQFLGGWIRNTVAKPYFDNTTSTGFVSLGTSAGNYGLPQILYTAAGNTDLVSCPNNANQDFATTYTIPANYLVTNKLIRVTLAFGLTSSASPPAGTAIQLKLGSTVAWKSSSSSWPASLTNVPISVSFLIQGGAAAGASAQVYVHPQLPAGNSQSAWGPLVNVLTPVTQPSLATNGTLVMTPGLSCSVNTAGNSLTLQQMVVEALN